MGLWLGDVFGKVISHVSLKNVQRESPIVSTAIVMAEATVI